MRVALRIILRSPRQARAEGARGPLPATYRGESHRVSVLGPFESHDVMAFEKYSLRMNILEAW